MIVLEMKCPQLSMPEATAARNENSIGDRMERKSKRKMKILKRWKSFFFSMKSSSVERDEFLVVAWQGSSVLDRGGGDHSTSQEWWTRMFWRVILSLSVMVPRGVAH